MKVKSGMIGFFALAALGSGGFSAAALINFDDLASGTPLTTQYQAQGVTFTGFEGLAQIAPEVRSQQFISIPASLPNYLTNFHNFPSTDNGDRLDEIRIIFAAGTSNIEFDLNTAGQNTISVDIYDINDVFVQNVGAVGSGTSNVHISLPGSNIGRLSMLQPSDDWWWSLDNLQFAQGQAVPAPGALALLGIGFAGFAFSRRRKHG